MDIDSRAGEGVEDAEVIQESLNHEHETNWCYTEHCAIVECGQAEALAALTRLRERAERIEAKMDAGWDEAAIQKARAEAAEAEAAEMAALLADIREGVIVSEFMGRIDAALARINNETTE